MLTERIHRAIRTTKRHQEKLEDLGIKTLKDLFFYFPRAYEDLSQFSKVSEIRTDCKNVLKGKVTNLSKRRARTGKLLISGIFSDNTGSVEVIWFNQPYILEVLNPNEEIILSGKASFDFNRITLKNPDFEKVKENLIHTARIVPIYHESPPITSKWVREKIALTKSYLDFLEEYMPEEILERQKLINFKKAIKSIHFPSSKDLIIKSRERLAFDELFLIQLIALQKRWQWMKNYSENELNISISEDFLNEFKNKLPFTLTNAQQKVIDEVFIDLQKKYPMLRLLQGDVGSGKTAVAAAAAYAVYKNGLQTAIMAPTEILAKQHFNSLTEIFGFFDVKMDLLVGSLSEKNKKNIAEKIKNGQIDIIIGTHALIQEYVHFKNLGLAVIDEQHRFGVKQRDILKSHGTPHLLNMTATPIPRTLALTLYGDQDISIIDEMPKGRKNIITRIVPEHKRRDAYFWIEDQVKKGRQVFVICPLVDESDYLEVKSATQEYEKLSREIFQNLKVGLVHGKLKADEKDKAMNDFKEKKIEVLVSTSVVEVGIDVPNATIMMIEGAERFGLSQLHQFRGRVGRGEHKSYCFLFTDSNAQNSLKRLKSMEKNHSGFKLAEIDLEQRGPGEIYGINQSGIPDLKMASLSDFELIKRARNEAIKIISQDPTLDKYVSLKGKLNEFINDYNVSICP